MADECQIVWMNRDGQYERVLGDLDVEDWRLLLRLMREHYPQQFAGATLQARADDKSPWCDVAMGENDGPKST
jgi:hypothetical protein